MREHFVSTALVIIVDIIAMAILVFGLYFPRHRRKDLVGAYIGVNIGVLAVSEVLTSSTVSFGLGMGLFGVLSIIRLRSHEIDQSEVAYYFASLAIGLLVGLTPEPSVITPALVTLVVLSLYVGDHPALFADHRQQLVVVDRAIASEDDLRAHLEQLLEARVGRMSVVKLDIVNDSTVVDVRYRVNGK